MLCFVKLFEFSNQLIILRCVLFGEGLPIVFKQGSQSVMRQTSQISRILLFVHKFIIKDLFEN